MNVNKDPVIIIKQKYHKEVITGSRRISNWIMIKLQTSNIKVTTDCLLGRILVTIILS